MKKKSDYAIVLTCNPGYAFGMLSTMNAQDYFNTDADWEIGYEGFEPAYMEKVSSIFPRNVHWTPISELIKNVVDRRTDKRCSLDRFWIGYWLLADKLLKEKKYKAVCVTQADQFTFVNLDSYFKLAAEGKIISSHYGFTNIGVEKLPYGNDKAIWDRCMCGIFDSLNFLGQQHSQIPMEIVNFQAEDAFKGEANHSVIALNRAVCKHCNKDMMIGLDANQWCCDHMWHLSRFKNIDDKIYTEQDVQMMSWHNRWWQIGRHQSEFNKNYILANKVAGNLEYFKHLDIQEHNYEFIRSFMAKFNNMIPEIKSECYEKEIIKRPRYELGE